MKYKRMDWGTMEAVVNLLGGMRGVRLLLSGNLDVKEKAPRVWKTIRLGIFKTKDEIRKSFKYNGINFDEVASEMLNNDLFKLAADEYELELVKMTTERLAGKEGKSTTAEVYAGARSYGLEECPPEAGPGLRRAYKNRSIKKIYIGMIICAGSIYCIFAVESSEWGNPWLRSTVCAEYTLWDGNAVWVFARREVPKFI